MDDKPPSREDVIQSIVWGFIFGAVAFVLPTRQHGTRGDIIICAFFLGVFIRLTFERPGRIIATSVLVGLFLLAGVLIEMKMEYLIIEPIVWYLNFLYTKPYTCLVFTILVGGTFYLVGLYTYREFQSYRKRPFRVRLANGETGTIDPKDFDPETMTRL